MKNKAIQPFLLLALIGLALFLGSGGFAEDHGNDREQKSKKPLSENDRRIEFCLDNVTQPFTDSSSLVLTVQ